MAEMRRTRLAALGLVLLTTATLVRAVSAERQRAVDDLYRATSPEAMRGAATGLGVEWVLYGIVERERYGTEGEAVLERLRAAGPVAAAFPPEDPRVFLFDLREADTP